MELLRDGHGDREDQFRCVRAHHNATDHGAGPLAGNDLDEAVLGVAHLGAGIAEQGQHHNIALVLPGREVGLRHTH
ncbi:hypothetical protein D3C85_1769220 [compost metagenome]